MDFFVEAEVIFMDDFWRCVARTVNHMIICAMKLCDVDFLGIMLCTIPQFYFMPHSAGFQKFYLKICNVVFQWTAAFQTPNKHFIWVLDHFATLLWTANVTILNTLILTEEAGVNSCPHNAEGLGNKARFSDSDSHWHASIDKLGILDPKK